MAARRSQPGERRTRQGVRGVRGSRPASHGPTASHVSQSRALTAQLALAARSPQLLQPSSVCGPGYTKGCTTQEEQQAIDQAGSSPAKEQPTQVIAASVFFLK